MSQLQNERYPILMILSIRHRARLRGPRTRCHKAAAESTVPCILEPVAPYVAVDREPAAAQAAPWRSAGTVAPCS